MTLFSGLGTDVRFSGDEAGLQWEGSQNAVEWRMVYVQRSRRAISDARY